MSITRIFRLTEYTDDEPQKLTGAIAVFDEKGNLVSNEPVDLSAFPGNIVADFFIGNIDGVEPTGPESGESEADTSPKRGHLPDGFPGKAALEAADAGTYAKVRALIAKGPDWFDDVPGVGKATATLIEAAV